MHSRMLLASLYMLGQTSNVGAQTTVPPTTPAPWANYSSYCNATHLFCPVPEDTQLFLGGSEEVTACQSQMNTEDPEGGKIFTFEPDGCNVSFTTESGQITMRAILVPKQNSLLIGENRNVVRVLCSCIYDTIQGVSLGISLENADEERQTEGSNEFTPPNLTLYTDAAYSAIYQPGQLLSATLSRFYFEVKAANDEDIVGVLNCTTSPAVNSLNPHTFQSESCPAGGLLDYTQESSTSAQVKRFSTRAFKFAGSDSIYMNCIVERCPAIPCGECLSRRLNLELGRERRLQSLDDDVSSSTTEFAISAAGPRTMVMATDDMLTSGRLSLVWTGDMPVRQVGGAFLFNVSIRGCHIFGRSDDKWQELADTIVDYIEKWLSMTDSLVSKQIRVFATDEEAWAEMVVVEFTVISSQSYKVEDKFQTLTLSSAERIDVLQGIVTDGFEEIIGQRGVLPQVSVQMGSLFEAREPEDSAETEAGFWDSTVVHVILVAIPVLGISLLTGGLIKKAYDRYKKQGGSQNTNPV